MLCLCFECVDIYVSLCVHIQCLWKPKTPLDHLELAVQVIVSCPYGFWALNLDLAHDFSQRHLSSSVFFTKQILLTTGQHSNSIINLGTFSLATTKNNVFFSKASGWIKFTATTLCSVLCDPPLPLEDGGDETQCLFVPDKEPTAEQSNNIPKFNLVSQQVSCGDWQEQRRVKGSCITESHPRWVTAYERWGSWSSLHWPWQVKECPSQAAQMLWVPTEGLTAAQPWGGKSLMCLVSFRDFLKILSCSLLILKGLPLGLLMCLKKKHLFRSGIVLANFSRNCYKTDWRLLLCVGMPTLQYSRRFDTWYISDAHYK